MKGHLPKQVPDRILKGMILKTIFESEGLLTSREIHDYVSSNTFYFESPELNKFGRPLFSGNYTFNTDFRQPFMFHQKIHHFHTKIHGPITFFQRM